MIRFCGSKCNSSHTANNIQAHLQQCSVMYDLAPKGMEARGSVGKKKAKTKSSFSSKCWNLTMTMTQLLCHATEFRSETGPGHWTFLEAKKHKLIKSSILIERTSNFGNVTLKEGNKTIPLQGESWRLEWLYCHHDVERYDISGTLCQCDKEITLPELVRTDLDKKLIALRSRESSPSSSADSLSSSSEPESYSES